MKKGISFLLLASMLASLVAGCSQSNDSSPAPESSSTAPVSSAAESSGSESAGGLSAEAGSFPLTDEKVEFSLMIQDSATVGPLDQNEFYKWYEEKTGVHINFTEVPAAAMVEQVNLMLVSGDYPDMMMCCGASLGVTPSLEMLYGSQGVFLPLNSYIEKWGKETQEVFSLYSGQLPAAITATDGNIYSLPNINDCYHCTYTGKLWINQTWLDTLKLPAPTTTEEFREVLRAFKNNDPNGNGKADEIPIMGSKAYGSNGNPNLFLLNSFLYCPNSPDMLYVDDNGKVACAATQPEYKDGLAYIRSLVEEGLLDASTYTQTGDQLKQFAIDPEGMKLGAYPHMTATNITDTIDNTPDQRTKNYGPLAPLKGPAGYQNTPITGQPYYSGYFIITSACENPELAFRWADGLYSEECTLNSQIGMPDTGRIIPTEGSKGINGEPALYQSIKIPAGTDNFVRAQNITLARRTSDFRLAQYVDYSDPDYRIRDNEVRLFEATRDFYEPYAHAQNHLPDAYLTEEEASEVAQLTSTVSSYIEEQMVLFILGSRDLDTEWDSYLKEFDSMNLNRLLEIRQAAYDRQYK
ncbi:MAG: extracellular solute-binding protein [Provencibacterium sp.]|jgi:putative aldouronate transport system substrate-binding protein|nr:extracellular solute-binding protein [Provencibacterium sp.]